MAKKSATTAKAETPTAKPTEAPVETSAKVEQPKAEETKPVEPVDKTAKLKSALKDILGAWNGGSSVCEMSEALHRIEAIAKEALG